MRHTGGPKFIFIQKEMSRTNATDVLKAMREENAKIERERQKIEKEYNINKGKGHKPAMFSRGRKAR